MGERVVVVAAGRGERRRARRAAKANPGARVVVRSLGGRVRFSVMAGLDGVLNMELLYEHSRPRHLGWRWHILPARAVRPVYRFRSWGGYPPRWQVAYYERRGPGTGAWEVVPGSEAADLE